MSMTGGTNLPYDRLDSAIQSGLNSQMSENFGPGSVLLGLLEQI